MALSLQISDALHPFCTNTVSNSRLRVQVALLYMRSVIALDVMTIGIVRVRALCTLHNMAESAFCSASESR
jgi:hypothetical protein